MSMGTFAGMGLGMWAFWIIIIVVIVMGIRLLTGNTPSQPGSTTESALEILDKRFARGEIDRREYDRMKNELGK